MNGLIEVIEKATGKIIQEYPIDNIVATNLLAALPDKCPEAEAKYMYKVYTVHHAGIKSLADPAVFTSVLHRIDLSRPFGREHEIGAAVIVLSEDGLPAGNGVIKGYSIVNKTYLVDISYPGSDITDTGIPLAASRLKTLPDFKA